jgi:hypothetical protein
VNDQKRRAITWAAAMAAWNKQAAATGGRAFGDYRTFRKAAMTAYRQLTGKGLEWASAGGRDDQSKSDSEQEEGADG